MSYRVIQWSSGNVGRYSIEGIIDRPDLSLVGLAVTDPAKHGRDAGEIVGRDPLGVVATTDVDEIVALDADVVIHTPLPSLVHGDDPDADVDLFCRLLERGTNVITTVGYMYPKVHGPELVARLDAAGARGPASFHGTGANPGWFGDLLPLLMSSLSRRIDRIAVQEISNFQHYPSPQIMFDIMGFGTTPGDFAARSDRHRRWLDGLFREALQMVADGLALPVDELGSDMTTWLADRDFDTAAGQVAAGTVAGQRWTWAAVVGDRRPIEQETVWRMHADAAPDWPQGHWSVTVDGEPAMRVVLEHGWNRNVLMSTAAHALNAIPYVVAAAPGIRTFLDLPMIAGAGAVR